LATFDLALDDDMAAMLTLDSPTGRNGPTSDSTY
jgi:hypothetical protein